MCISLFEIEMIEVWFDSIKIGNKFIVSTSMASSDGQRGIFYSETIVQLTIIQTQFKEHINAKNDFVLSE